MSLPPDIYGCISDYLPLSNQAAFRRASTATYSARVDWQKKCCEPPTTTEIVNWLWKQHLLLSNPGTRSQYKIKFESDNLVFFPFADIANQYDYLQQVLIILDVRTGKLLKGLESNNNINSKDELLNILSGKQPYMKSTNNWKMLRGIFSQRTICITKGILPDRCYLELLANYLSSLDWETLLVELHFLINRQAFSKLFDDMSLAFNLSIVFDDFMWDNYQDDYLDSLVPEMDTIPLDVYGAWIKRWILNLQSSDLD